MTNKAKVALIVGSLATAFALGRYTLPAKIVIQTVEHQAEVTKSDTDRDKHKETTVTETVKPDGSKETITKTTEDTKTVKKIDKAETSDKNTKSETTYAKSSLSVYGLVGYSDVLSGHYVPVYGGLLSRPIFGPISIGGWFLTTGIIGVTIGLHF